MPTSHAIPITPTTAKGTSFIAAKKVITRQIDIDNHATLTPREIQCLVLTAQGMNTKEIASSLYIST